MSEWCEYLIKVKGKGGKIESCNLLANCKRLKGTIIRTVCSSSHLYGSQLRPAEMESGIVVPSKCVENIGFSDACVRLMSFGKGVGK